ncbi:MAG: hypothetical protein R3C97_04095 [Geminicoccaceae bacterium]
MSDSWIRSARARASLWAERIAIGLVTRLDVTDCLRGQKAVGGHGQQQTLDIRAGVPVQIVCLEIEGDGVNRRAIRPSLRISGVGAGIMLEWR